MKAKRILKTLVILMILGSNIGCDQISKNIIRQKIGDNERIGLMNNYLTITKVENTGAFLSVGQSLPRSIKLILLTLLPIIVIALTVFFILKKQKLYDITIIGLCFMAGGGIGNIYDRAIYSSVTDFLHIDFGIFQTGIFNMADVSIMTGFFVILIDLYLKKTKLNFGIADKKGND